MSLSKQQMIGAIGAGVFTVCAGGLGYMLWDAYSVRTEAEEQLDSETQSFNGYNQSPVFPSKKSIDSVKSNEQVYAAWYDAAHAFAAGGDRVLPIETPPIFKQRLQNEVRRMVALPGGLDGKIAAPEFLFGFDQFLGEGGVLPKDAEVPLLAVQLDAISRVVGIFADSGIVQITSVARVARKTDEDEDRGKKKSKGKKNAEADEKVTELDFEFGFTTRAPALVGVMNRLASDRRFLSVKALAFKQGADTVVERLDAIAAAEAEAAKPATAATGGRRGRRGRGGFADSAAEKKEPAAVDALVTDPETDAPIAVTMTVTLHDFGCGVAAEAKPEGEVKKDEAKGDDKSSDKAEAKPEASKEEGK